MITQVKQIAWVNADGRELVKLKENGFAYVVVCDAKADMLDDLAEACTAAAEALRLIGETQQQRIET